MTNRIYITVQHSIVIIKPCGEVFDFTQDFSKRMLWDKSLVESILISESPLRTAFIKVKGGMTAKLEYKLFERPHKTSLRLTNIKSPFVIGGGGSWVYEKQYDGTTLWTQTNTISLKNTLIGKLLKGFVEKILRKNTVRSMQNAKMLIEINYPCSK